MEPAPAYGGSAASDTVRGGTGAFTLFFDEPPVHPPVQPPCGCPVLLNQLLEAHSGEHRREIVGAAVQAMGFDGLTYGRMNLVAGEPVPTAFCVSHGDSDWTRRYFARRYHMVDPRLQLALHSSLPCRWNTKSLQRMVASGRKNDAAGHFLEAMHEAGMRCGVLLAMPGPATDERSIVSLSSRSADCCGDSDGFIADVLMLSLCLHEFYAHYAQWPQKETSQPPKLTVRQDQILHGLARGLTDREIAKSLGLSMHGVDYHLRRLRECFNARNRVELVQAAFSAGSF